MSTISGTTLKDLISQLSYLIKRRPTSPIQKREKQYVPSEPKSTSERSPNLSRKDLDYIVEETTKRILDSLLHNKEVQEGFRNALCSKCNPSYPSNMDISFCSPPKNDTRPVLKEIGNNKVEWIVNMHHIRNKTDQLVSKINDIL